MNASLLLLALLSNWPQWRGPANDGISPEKKPLPAEWSETKNLAWKLDLPGEGYSTPCVWGDDIFLSSMDGKKVWCFSGNGTLAAFDFKGEEKWRLDVQKKYGRFQIAFGMHSTPVLHDGKLYLQLIHDGGGTVAKLDAATGKEEWKIERVSDGVAENKHSYASPFLWTDGKSAYLVTHGQDYAIAYTLDKGEEIWRLAGLNPEEGYRNDLRFVASPVCTPGLIVVPTAKNKSIVGVKPDAKGRIEAGGKGEAWRNKTATPDVPSPIVHDGLVYLVGEWGSFTVLDASTGKQVYGKPRGRERHRANPMLADGKVFFASRDSGTVKAVAAGKEYKLLGTNTLPDKFGASPAVSGGRLYLRGLKSLWAIEAK
ncbi:MAG: PQQ-binding-like beta-propeller repeat protein [Gemmataceae bacterium]|nr:PQQ-binding-like beta-propeller repeat protein [Gemmataceae bacterium]